MDADGADPAPLVATSGGSASWQPVPPLPGEPIPTVSKWGRVMMQLVVLAVGSIVLRGYRRSDRQVGVKPGEAQTLGSQLWLVWGHWIRCWFSYPSKLIE